MAALSGKVSAEAALRISREAIKAQKKYKFTSLLLAGDVIWAIAYAQVGYASILDETLQITVTLTSIGEFRRATFRK